MQVGRRLRATKHPAQTDLAPCRIEQIRAPDNQIHVLFEIIDGHRELVRPVAIAIAQQQVAALVQRCLFKDAEQQIGEPLAARLELDAKTPPGGVGEATGAAMAVIPVLAGS